ncbi:MAG: ABC transporter permease [Chloroflexi bacterium]|nr:ABC transporter permease [Chloroflexota bacterium]
MSSIAQPRSRLESVNLGALTTPAIFLLAFVLFWALSPGHRFADPRNLAAMAKLTPDLGIVALGVGILMIAGEFDLSIGSILPLSSFIFAQLLLAGVPPALAFIIVIPCGALLGLTNGLLVVRTGLPSFIVTLSAMLFWRGVLYVVSGLMPISILKYVSRESLFAEVFTGTVGGVPIQFIWFVIFAIILGIVLHLGKFGNWIYASGGAKEAARAMGVRVGMTKVTCFAILGMLCAFAAIMQATRLGSFAATQGIGFELKAIAAVVVGGVSLRGGIGNMLGIALGVFIIQIIDNGLILMQVPVYGINFFIGMAVIFFVIINNAANRQFSGE